VIASDTMIATGGRILPFVSQVDEFTAEPSNPHVHLEVIDTSIPDRPSSGGGCSITKKRLLEKSKDYLLYL
jgi:hypothetical protein